MGKHLRGFGAMSPLAVTAMAGPAHTLEFEEEAARAGLALSRGKDGGFVWADCSKAPSGCSPYSP
ncbi:MAG: hypothetical protein ACI9MR_004361 [Myxococcota bacterium]|jgi:hypothetical protein